MYCEYEARDCPVSEFEPIRGLGLVHILEVVVSHTVAGDELGDLVVIPSPVKIDLPLPLVELGRGE